MIDKKIPNFNVKTDVANAKILIEIDFLENVSAANDFFVQGCLMDFDYKFIELIKTYLMRDTIFLKNSPVGNVRKANHHSRSQK